LETIGENHEKKWRDSDNYRVERCLFDLRKLRTEIERNNQILHFKSAGTPNG